MGNLIKILLAISILIFVLVPLGIGTVEIKGDSMLPSFKDGQDYLVNKLERGILSRSDVVLARISDKENVERVIGLPGDIIKITSGDVYINGDTLKEPYLNTISTKGGTFLRDGQEFLVPDGNYVLLGDNRSKSVDSRDLGFISSLSILGKVWFCYLNCN